MRSTICAALVLTTLALTVPQAQAAPQADATGRTQLAVSAERYGVKASYQGPVLGHGYSPLARHMADCLATYPGYDPETDLVRVAPGVARRCTL